jgi:hypothetical protein
MVSITAVTIFQYHLILGRSTANIKTVCTHQEPRKSNISFVTLNGKSLRRRTKLKEKIILPFITRRFGIICRSEPSEHSSSGTAVIKKYQPINVDCQDRSDWLWSGQFGFESW